MRRDIHLETRVESCHYREAERRWELRASQRGEASVWSARYVVMATGCLSVPLRPELSGIESYRGEVYQTSRWPDRADLAGKRVGLIGTGSSGVQDFSFDLPPGPYTFSGKLIAMVWALELVLHPSGFTDRVEFIYSPDWREIELCRYPIPDDLKENSHAAKWSKRLEAKDYE